MMRRILYALYLIHCLCIVGFTQAPSIPTATAGTNKTFASFTANWNSVSGATEYLLDVSESSTFTSYLSGYQGLVIAGSTNRDILGLAPNTTYYYRVRAKNSSGTSGNSNTISVITVLQPPVAKPPPSVYSASFFVKWSLVPGATSYKIDVSTNSNFSTFVSYYNNYSTSTLTGASDTTGMVNSSLSSGTTYYYRFRAVNSSSTSANSNVVAVTTIPPPPSATAATYRTNTSFAANWNATSGATEYRLDVSTNTSFSSFVSGYQDLVVSDIPSKSVTGLTANTTYYYRVRAKNPFGTSGNSSTITTVTLLPAPLANAATSVGATSFAANLTPVSGATLYVIDVSTSPTFSSFVGTYNNASFSPGGIVSTGVTAGTTYYYRFRAGNGSGTSANSNVISISTIPAAPTTAAATNITNTSFTANWNSVTGATEYRLDVSTNSSFSTYVSGYQNLLVSGSTSQNITGLNIGTNYYIRVRAKNASGSSPNSSTLTVSTFSYPAPQSTAATTVTSTSFKANGTTVPGASYYVIDVSTNSAFTSFVGTYNNSSFSLGGTVSTGITGGTTYYYRFRVNNGASAYSNVTSVTTVPPIPTATAASDKSSISFTANWNTTTGASEYRLDVSTSNTFSSYVPGYQDRQVIGVNSLVVTGLTANTNYYYRVRARNSSGTSGNSGTITSTTLLVGIPVATAATLLQSSGFTANWNPVPDATSYRLDVSTSSSFSSYVSGYQDLNVTAISKTITGLTPNTTYYYRVRAKNALATSVNSNVITVSNILITSPSIGQYVTLNGNIIVQFTCGSSINNGIVKVYKGATLVYTNPYFYVFPGYDITIPTVGFTPGDDYKVKIEDAYNTSVYGWSEPFRIRQGQNFILATDIVKEGIKTDADIYNALVADKIVNYSFFDGLGRLEQTVTMKGSPLQKDIVKPVAYDQFGREPKSYLPYASTGTDGWFKNDALKDPGTTATTEIDKYKSGAQFLFYQLGGLVASDEVPYAETLFEPSPLNRPIKQFGPGEDWAAAPIGNNKFVEMKYLVNTHSTGASATQEKIIAWEVNDAGMPVRAAVATGYVVTGGYYNSGQLIVTVTIDEELHHVREYTNKNGQVILKKIQAGTSNTNLNSNTDWASTYYLYDEFGNLRYVFPPELTKVIHQGADTDVVSASNLNIWAFQYKYDQRNRMIQKQVPGTKPMYMVYDKRDRVILTQDGNQRRTSAGALKKEWLFTKYDIYNRPVITGLYIHPDNDTSQVEMQTYVNTVIASGNQFYEDYNGVAATEGYTNRVFPTTGITTYTVTYYDNYNFITPVINGGNASITTYNYQLGDITGQYEYDPVGTQKNFPRVGGLATGTKVNILGTSNYMYGVVYYDDKYRVVQTITQNHKSGNDRVTSKYDFSGKVLENKRTYLVSGVSRTVKETFTYDHVGRLLTVKHSTNGAADVMITKNEYNELGQLVDKKLHSEDNGTTFKQSVDYRYNIRGWMTKINDSDVSSLGSGETLPDYFGMELAYTNSLSNISSTAAYNGNISALKWSIGTVNASNLQGNHYNYDPLNRLYTTSHYKSGLAGFINDNSNLETNFSYDLNGNISGLTRKGSLAATIDNLTYNYTGNKLNYVNDAADATKGFINGNVGTDDYAYDVNGNLIKDKNKGIVNNNDIKYNYLNLPSEVTKGADKVKYFYDATGRKLYQELYAGASLTKTTDYLGELIFENNALQFLNHAEGRVLADGGNWEYQYHLKDHLGNVRVTFTAKTQATVNHTTNFEAATNSNFQNYNSMTFDLVDHTDAAGTVYQKVQKLNGGVNNRVGLAKSIAVMPGDVVSASVYAKYMNLNGNANLTPFINSLAGAFGVSSPVTTDQIKIYNELNDYAGTVAGGQHPGDDDLAPKAFVTILFFDKEYTLLDATWDQITTSGQQPYGKRAASRPNVCHRYCCGSRLCIHFSQQRAPHRGRCLF